MIKTFSVEGLFGKHDHEFTLDPSLNIFTGRNGSGKTTLLKLLWYMISANLERIGPEIEFREACVTTDEFSLHITCDGDPGDRKCRFIYRRCDGDPVEATAGGDTPRIRVERINRLIAELPSGSVFFPTFRRIEGGFSMGRRSDELSPYYEDRGRVSSVIARYAREMSAGKHQFVASLSTDDIELLLRLRYASASKSLNDLYQRFTGFISNQVATEEGHSGRSRATSMGQNPDHSKNVLRKIRAELGTEESQKETLMRPFTVLSDLADRVFRDKRIKISEDMVLGHAGEPIQASLLSAGEKQMLSFLCYNTFTHRSPIFIDEPELSLHADWQRTLLPTLLAQKTGNQFIVATHSPFIYTKYPESEMLLDQDRGQIS